MFNTWDTGLGDVQIIPVNAEIINAAAGYVVGSPIQFRVTGAPGQGVLVQIQKKNAGGNYETTQAANWEGRRTDENGAVSWSIDAPAAGEYRYTFIVPIIGANVDPQDSVDFRTVAVATDPIIEDGGGLQIPQTINLFGLTMSPLMLAGLAGLGFLILKGRGK